MGAPGFWDDQERASSVSAEHAARSRRLETFRSLERDIEDLEALEEMAQEDESIAAELDEQRASILARLAELEEARLFSGEYDSGDAVVTVNAGAGGTDSQDWAEMLLRMEMRWAERRGMKVELKEASAGEEAGIKSASFIARGDNAYGLFSAEKGVHRLVRISPFDSQSRRHTAFAGVEVAPPSRTLSISRSSRMTSRSTRTGPPARAASTSTRPTPRCASRTGRAASSCSARTSARSRRTATPRCGCCAPS